MVDLVRKYPTGSTSGEAAGIGEVGEYIESVGSTATSIANNTYTTVHSYLLPAGDWDVWGYVNFDHSGLDGTSKKRNIISISTATNTGQDPRNTNYMEGNNLSLSSAPIRRILFSVPTLVYLVVSIGDIAGTAGTRRAVTPTIFARRIR